MPNKSYHGPLPKPDFQGRWRPVVGRSPTGIPQRFQVGNKRDTTEAEAQRRLDYIRDLFDRQCAEEGIDYWAGWALPWAHRIASGPPILVYASGYAKVNAGQAAEEVAYDFIRNRVETEVNRAVEQALDKLGKSWGAEAIGHARQKAIPNNLMDAETRTLHEALDVYSNHLRATGSGRTGGKCLENRSVPC